MSLRIPILGRLSFNDYLRLFLAMTILMAETLLRLIYAFTPLPWILDRISPRQLTDGREEGQPVRVGIIRSSRGSKVDIKTRVPGSVEVVQELAFCNHVEDMIKFWGYPVDTHYCTTKDGYILSLQRIHSGVSETTSYPPHSPRKHKYGKPVVLLWHGFMMCSEVWVCHPDPKNSIAFILADAGYDVWLGNSRGNKYSCKHQNLKSTTEEFWDFSIDSFAQFDIPDTVDHILKIAGVPSLSYIGFSQGTAQGYAALSLNKKLNHKINLFIALAPATKPSGLENETVNTLISASPDIIYLLFGRKSLIPSAVYWKAMLPRPAFVQLIDACLNFLFSWKTKMIDHKAVFYGHLYSYTSVKSVVQWFQVISTGRFQMYDENPSFLRSSGHHIPEFPTKQIETPIGIFYGGQDTLADLGYLLSKSPDPVFCLKVDEYEHLDFLWGRGLNRTVAPGLLGLLAHYNPKWPSQYTTTPNTPTSPQVITPILPFTYQVSLGGNITEREVNHILEIGKWQGSKHGGRVSAIELIRLKEKSTVISLKP